MSAINYSKWDDLEISDDSDIECHPNVIHRTHLAAVLMRDMRLALTKTCITLPPLG